jgi:hypothetical protein
MTEITAKLRIAIADRHVIEREPGAGGVATSAVRRHGATGVRGSDG